MPGQAFAMALRLGEGLVGVYPLVFVAVVSQPFRRPLLGDGNPLAAHD